MKPQSTRRILKMFKEKSLCSPEKYPFKEITEKIIFFYNLITSQCALW